jgi:hypothetical protein
VVNNLLYIARKVQPKIVKKVVKKTATPIKKVVKKTAAKKSTSKKENYVAYLRPTPPMAIYKTLFDFKADFGANMGDPGTHPWSQGFPLTQ